MPHCFHRVAALSDTLLQLEFGRWELECGAKAKARVTPLSLQTCSTLRRPGGEGGLPLPRPERHGLVSGLLPKMACREMLGSQPWLSGLYVFFGCDRQCLLGGDSAVLAPLPSRQRPDLIAMNMRPRCQPLVK